METNDKSISLQLDWAQTKYGVKKRKKLFFRYVHSSNIPQAEPNIVDTQLDIRAIKWISI